MNRITRRACGHASRALYSLALWVQQRAEALDHASVPPKRPRPLQFETASERMMRGIVDAAWSRMREKLMADLLAPQLDIFADRPVLIRMAPEREMRSVRTAPLIVYKDWNFPDGA